jgi:hypothetical protein
MSAEYSPIPELNLLKDYEDRWYVSQGFEFFEYNRRDAGLVEWFGVGSQPELHGWLDRLVPFAQATGSGSFYALWRCDDREDLATLPVVRFGDEGGLDIVASGLRDLFRLLALDDEWLRLPDEDEEEEEDEEEREARMEVRERYLDWLDRTFGLTWPEDPDAIQDAAMLEHGQRFADWLRQFAPGAADALFDGFWSRGWPESTPGRRTAGA